MKKGGECVRVAVRCRPISKGEIEQQRQVIVNVYDTRGEIAVKNTKGEVGETDKSFTFDIVIPPNSTQERVYQKTAEPIVESVLEGYNGTIFAYGQTGTGKTHTMEGKANPPELRGIIPRTFEHIFQVINGTPNKQFLVMASYIELYNEEVRDLLSKNYKSKLDLRENPDSGVYVKDLSAFKIVDIEDLKNKLEQGHSNRAVASTDMNMDSSRSHSIFMITIEQITQVGTDGQSRICAGKLNLVDLAGSERQSKTHATGDRFKEAININQSLATLGNVISSLVDGKIQHVPYRDSKLTRLLQDSLGGNTRTVMIANVGPADYNFDETISTLRYANRAKNIKNKPKINEDPKDTKIREYQEEINRLRDELQKKMGGQVFIGEDGSVTQIMEEVQVVKIEDKEKLKQLEEKLHKERDEIHNIFEAQMKEIESRKNINQEEKLKLQSQLEEREKHQQRAREEQEELVHKLRQMEEQVLQGKEANRKKRDQDKELLRVRLEKEEKEIQERRVKEELEKRTKYQDNVQTNVTNLGGDIEVKNKKINALIQKIQEAKTQTTEIHEYRLREKEILLEENRVMIRELKLINLIIEHFIPEDEVKKLQQKLDFSDELDDWVIKEKVEEVKIKKPCSAHDLKRPMCEFSKMAINFGDPNPRFRADNIITLDLDLPDRTTEDFDGTISQKLQETINIALNEDEEDMAMIQKETMPNVYIENPDLINKKEDILQAQKKPRLMSARKQGAKRPGSGFRK